MAKRGRIFASIPVFELSLVQSTVEWCGQKAINSVRANAKVERYPKVIETYYTKQKSLSQQKSDS